MLRLFLNGSLYYSFNEEENHIGNRSGYIITALKREKEINSLSSLSFTTLITHPRASDIQIKRSLIILADNNRCLFIGKPSDIKKNPLSGTMDVDCEDIFGCLRDEIAIDVENPDGGDVERTYQTLFAAAMNGLQTYSGSVDEGIFGYNSSVTLPYPTITGNSISVDSLLNDKSTDSYFGSDYLSILYSTVLNYTGGVVNTWAEGTYSIDSYGIDYNVSRIRVDYRVDLREAPRDSDGYYSISDVPSSVLNSVDFECGVNIIEFEHEPSQKYPVSAIVPFGSFKNTEYNNEEEKIYLGRASIMPLIVKNDLAVAKYGYIAKAIDFGDLGSSTQSNAQNNLRVKATSWAIDHLKPFCDKYTITGVDKYYINGITSPKNRPLDICDLVHVDFGIYSEDGVDDFIDYLLSLSIDYFNHENDRYIIGPYIPDNILEYNSSNLTTKNSKYGEAVMTTTIPGVNWGRGFKR